jgi:hypothetical protein
MTGQSLNAVSDRHRGMIGMAGNEAVVKPDAIAP